MTNNDFTPQNNAQDNTQDQPLNFNKEPQQTAPEQNPHYSSPYTNQSSQREPYYGQPAPQQPQPQYQAPQPQQSQYQAPQQAPYGYGAPTPQQPYYNQAPQQNPYQQNAPRKNNSFAITAFVLGLAQILLWWAWVPTPLAVVFGHIALSQIKRTNEDGRVFALIGLILGYVGVFLSVVFLFSFFIFWASVFDGSSGYNDYSEYGYDENCYTCGSELM